MRNRLLTIVLVLLVASIVGAVILAGYSHEWMGFGMRIRPPKVNDQAVDRAKTLWDWMQLLLVPLVLFVLATWFNSVQKQAELDRAERRAAVDREIAAENMREAVLATYFESMTKLILDGELGLPVVEKLLETTQDLEALKASQQKATHIVAVAQAQTLAALRRLDAARKRRVLEFLQEAELIRTGKSVISLIHADATEADLVSVNLFFADLGGAALCKANLTRAHLSGADLSGANMEGAVLKGADLTNANLSNAMLVDADLTDDPLLRFKTNLSGANLSGALYSQNTKWPSGFDPIAAGASLFEVGN